MQLTVARYARRPGSLSSASRSCQTRCIATFVLIPGAGTDPLVYTATIEALSDLGHRALAPPLPLRDEHARPSDHADAVVRALPDDAEPVIVAQSLGAFTGPLVGRASTWGAAHPSRAHDPQAARDSGRMVVQHPA